MSENGESGIAARRRRLLRLALLPFRLALGALLRALVSGVALFACAAVTLRLLGYELPDASDLEQYLESIGELADVLS